MTKVSRWMTIIGQMYADGIELGVSPDKVYQLTVTEIMRAWCENRLSYDDARWLTDYTQGIFEAIREGMKEGDRS